MKAAGKGATGGSAARPSLPRTTMITALAAGLIPGLRGLLHCGGPAPPGARRPQVVSRLSRTLQRPPALAAGRAVAWWGVVSAAAAPVLLVAGWTVAAAQQPSPFNSLACTISALAEPGAAERWVMTAAFAVAGAGEIVTGLALRPAATPGRLILMAGGAAGVLVAANPDHTGGSLTHALWAAAGFAALVAWPTGAWRRGLSVPWGLRPTVSAGAAGVLLALLAWFLAELITGGGQAGLAERVMGVAQAGWPLAVMLSCRLSQAPYPDSRHRHWPPACSHSAVSHAAAG